MSVVAYSDIGGICLPWCWHISDTSWKPFGICCHSFVGKIYLVSSPNVVIPTIDCLIVCILGGIAWVFPCFGYFKFNPLARWYVIVGFWLLLYITLSLCGSLSKIIKANRFFKKIQRVGLSSIRQCNINDDHPNCLFVLFSVKSSLFHMSPWVVAANFTYNTSTTCNTRWQPFFSDYAPIYVHRRR